MLISRPGYRALLPKSIILLCWIAVILIILRWKGTYWDDDVHRPSFDASTLPPISKKIWQVTSDSQISMFQRSTTWQRMNPEYEYSVYGDTQAVEFTQNSYGDAFAQLLSSLQNKGIRSDLIRYLLLGAEGGIYSDTDTTPVTPIGEWAPEEYRNQTKLIVGVEWDERDDDPANRSGDLLHELQFCQWTIAAAPGHPVFAAMLKRAVAKIDEIRIERGVESVSDIIFQNVDILNSTGPAAWTDVVFDYLRLVDPSIQSLKNLSMLREPRLVGDVLIVPIDGFASGVPHSGATVGSVPETALIVHRFAGSWRNG
jgi:alpha 1,6-mannosyltransferase